jgi:hypothetical protein
MYNIAFVQDNRTTYATESYDPADEGGVIFVVQEDRDLAMTFTTKEEAQEEVERWKKDFGDLPAHYGHFEIVEQ